VLATGGRAAASDATAPATPEPSPPPAVGEVMPAFEATAIDGTVKAVRYPAGTTTVLLFFLSSCPHCHKMIPEWNRAVERKTPGLEIIGVLMDREPPGFFALMPVSFQVVRSPSREFLKIYKVHRAPLMLRVGPGGKVQDVAQGVIDPIRVGEIFRR
jgi:thiol-disulfide isomerase/thioredoxin